MEIRRKIGDAEFVFPQDSLMRGQVGPWGFELSYSTLDENRAELFDLLAIEVVLEALFAGDAEHQVMSDWLVDHGVLAAYGTSRRPGTFLVRRVGKGAHGGRYSTPIDPVRWLYWQMSPRPTRYNVTRSHTSNYNSSFSGELVFNTDRDAVRAFNSLNHIAPSPEKSQMLIREFWFGPLILPFRLSTSIDRLNAIRVDTLTGSSFDRRRAHQDVPPLELFMLWGQLATRKPSEVDS
jgi:hypothetical protein